MKYQKPALSIAEQLALWQAKGLVIADIPAAERALTFIGYFRLRGYALPFMQTTPQGRQFFPGTTLERILINYDFDRELRIIILRELEKIEVAVRTVISNTLSQSHGPFWYFNHPIQLLGHVKTQQGNIENFTWGSFLAEVERETRRSKDPFAKHFFSKYSEPLLPPSWLLTECLTFGKWSMLYKHLLQGKTSIASQFGLPVDVFESWLHCLTNLRNLCSHHGKLMQRHFIFRPKTLQREKSHFSNQQSFYCYAVVIRLLTSSVAPGNNWPKQLAALFAAHPAISPSELGFPNQWQNALLWK